MIVLGLGSNMGDRENNLAGALRLLAEKYSVVVDRISSIYETAPFGMTDQPDFLNMVAVVKTELSPVKLLEACLEAERELGRIRVLKWGPRIIDVDLLSYNEVHLDTERLVLPHPGICERAFVLIPLREVAPDLVLQNGLMPEQIVRENFSGDVGVKLWKKVNWDPQALCFV